jgi:hypothetical protein
MKKRIEIQNPISKILEETKNNIVRLKFQLEEARRIKQVVRIQLKENEQNL